MAGEHENASGNTPPNGNKTKGFKEIHPNGIGGYDLMAQSDRGFAFDFRSTGKLVDLVFYRPGHTTLWVINHQTTNGKTSFRHIFNEGDDGDVGEGIGGYLLDHESDRAFAFDFESSGKLDHIVLYNSIKKRLSIIKRKEKDENTRKKEKEEFVSVYQQDEKNPGSILLEDDTQMFAFDRNKNGCLDHLIVYRPGMGDMKVYGTSDLQ